MACPFFIPGERHPEELWSHRKRLPLGDGYSGRCDANPAVVLSDDCLRDHCNLGYAGCGSLPAQRDMDAARFMVSSETDGEIEVQFVCERDHLPVEVGRLHFDAETLECRDDAVRDPVLRLATACVRAWRSRSDRAQAATAQ